MHPGEDVRFLVSELQQFVTSGGCDRVTLVSSSHGLGHAAAIAQKSSPGPRALRAHFHLHPAAPVLSVQQPKPI